MLSVVICLRVIGIVLLGFLLAAPPCVCQFLTAFGLSSHEHGDGAPPSEVCYAAPDLHGGEAPCRCGEHEETLMEVAAGSDRRDPSPAFVSLRLVRSSPIPPFGRRAVRPARGPPGSGPPWSAPEVSGVFLL